MKSTICVLLLSIASNGVVGEGLDDILNRMAEKKQSINGIFEPSKQGYLGKKSNNIYRQDPFSCLYKGIFLPKNKEVAMKFERPNLGRYIYKMYTYLDAINKPNVEAYGIPAIYYYGTWDRCIIMAMTLLDPEFYTSNRYKNFNEIDLLIFVREYVRITKYMHSRGVSHGSINIENIWFRKHQGFIYDFNLATSLPEANRKTRLISARTNWKVFLSSMYRFIESPRSRWSWLGFHTTNHQDVTRMENTTNFASSLINDSQTNEAKNFCGLRKVMIEFAKYAYINDSSIWVFPFYDELYEIITEEIESYARQKNKPPIPSWLTDEQDKNNAIEAIDEIPPISDIADPFESDEIKYEEVNYEFFSEHYRNQPSSSWTSERPAPEKRSSSFFSRFKKRK